MARLFLYSLSPFAAAATATRGPLAHADEERGGARTPPNDGKHDPCCRAVTPGGVQSLKNWRIVAEDDLRAYFVELKGNPLVRFGPAPDASNTGVHGVPHPPFITQPNWDALRATPGLLRPSDIVVCTFPKSGTTLTEQIVLLLLEKGDPTRLAPGRQNSYVPGGPAFGKVWVEQVSALPRTLPAPPSDGARAESGTGASGRRRPTLAEFASLPAPRVVKTHSPRELFLGTVAMSAPTARPAPWAAAAPLPGRQRQGVPQGPLTEGQGLLPPPLLPGLRVVYVTRDPKDACVSSYYHAKNPHRLGWPFEAWAAAWAGGLFEHGTWWRHVQGWWATAQACPGQVHWVHYEALLAEPHAEVAKLARFVLGLGEGQAVDPALVDAVVRHSAFAEMRRRAADTRMAAFYRKGVAGDHRCHFDATLAAEFDAKTRAALGGVGGPPLEHYLADTQQEEEKSPPPP